MLEAALEGFPKRIPVFPLAGVVLFPGSVLPLHIFEERYKRMLEDAMAGDRLICMALLKQCSREEYEKSPPYHEVICVGKVIHHDRLDDGRSNIALMGISAGRATSTELQEAYLTAEIELLDDLFDTQPGYEDKLQRVFERTVPGEGDLDALRTQLSQYLAGEHIPAALVNTCALTASLLPLDKLELLEERSVARRLDRLLEFLQRPWQWN
ncbi:MAG: LON peptidase substrate-binding domain-containing protein [Planctomycetota bacterium]